MMFLEMNLLNRKISLVTKKSRQELVAVPTQDPALQYPKFQASKSQTHNQPKQIVQAFNPNTHSGDRDRGNLWST